MKIKLIAVLSIVLALTSNVAFAQLGGLGGALGKGGASAESLLTDFSNGTDFFVKAFEYYDQAFPFATNSAAKTAEIKGLKGKESSAAVRANSDRLAKAVDELIAAKKPLDKAQKELVDKAEGEIVKGIAKWAAIGGALALSASQGGGDAAMVAALPTLQQAVQDLPSIKKLLAASKKLKKLK